MPETWAKRPQEQVSGFDEDIILRMGRVVKLRDSRLAVPMLAVTGVLPKRQDQPHPLEINVIVRFPSEVQIRHPDPARLPARIDEHLQRGLDNHRSGHLAGHDLCGPTAVARHYAILTVDGRRQSDGFRADGDEVLGIIGVVWWLFHRGVLTVRIPPPRRPRTPTSNSSTPLPQRDGGPDKAQNPFLARTAP